MTCTLVAPSGITSPIGRPREAFRMSQHGSFKPSYFSIAERHRQICQGGDVRLTPLDWEYLAAWETAGLPIEAVVLGMHRTFENARRGPQNAPVPRIRRIAYCAQEIYAAAEQLAEDEVAGHGDFAAVLFGKSVVLKSTELAFPRTKIVRCQTVVGNTRTKMK